MEKTIKHLYRFLLSSHWGQGTEKKPLTPMVYNKRDYLDDMDYYTGDVLI